MWYHIPGVEDKDPKDCSYAYGAGINIISPKLGGDHIVQDIEDLTFYGHIGNAYGLLSACYVEPTQKIGFSYAFTGTSVPHEKYPGIYSSRSLWHERMMTTIYNHFFAKNKCYV